jgi:pimeloyl-ACP methyl ester carboxylesterase
MAWVMFAGVCSLAACGLIYAWLRRDGFVPVPGGRIAYTDEGHGVPVILVHGFAADSFVNWRLPGFIRALRRHYRVIAMDVRGHGRSFRPTARGTYGRELVEDIRRLMDHLEIDRACLIGYSMGGFIVMDFLGTYPDRVVAVCAGGAGWYPEDQYPDLVRTVPAALDAGQGMMPILAFMEPPRWWLDRVRLAIANRLICMVHNPSALARCFESLVELRGTEDQVRANRVPFLSFAGTRDPLRDGIDNMVGIAGNHKALFVEGGNHTTTLAWPPFARQCICAVNGHLRESCTAAGIGEASRA